MKNEYSFRSLDLDEIEHLRDYATTLHNLGKNLDYYEFERIYNLKLYKNSKQNEGFQPVLVTILTQELVLESNRFNKATLRALYCAPIALKVLLGVEELVAARKKAGG